MMPVSKAHSISFTVASSIVYGLWKYIAYIDSNYTIISFLISLFMSYSFYKIIYILILKASYVSLLQYYNILYFSLDLPVRFTNSYVKILLYHCFVYSFKLEELFLALRYCSDDEFPQIMVVIYIYIHTCLKHHYEQS